MKKAKLVIWAAFLLYANAGFSQRTLTLAECQRLALANNVAMKISRLEQAAAAYIRIKARTNYFPDVSAGAIYFDASKALMEINTAGGNLPVYDGNPLHLPTATQFAYFPSSTTSLLQEGKIGYIDILQPIYSGGRILNGNRLASLAEDVSGEKSKLVAKEIQLKTEEQYWQIVSLADKKGTVDKYEELLHRLSGQVEDAFASGLVMRNDVLKVKLKQSEVLLKKSKLENGRKLAMMAFCQYIGIPFDSTLVLAASWPKIDSPASYYVDPQTTLRNRSEYRLLEKSLRAEKLQTRMKRGEWMPQVGIGSRTMVTKFDEGNRRTMAVFFGMISIPISDWIGGAAELEERSVKEEIAATNLQNHSELLLLQMEKAWQDFNDSYRQVQLNEEAKAQAEENLKVNEDSYRNGLTSITDLLEAQALVQQSVDGFIDSHVDYIIKQRRYVQMINEERTD